jgi:YVTN family beta-propeller protein
VLGLGPIEVADGDRVLEIGGGRQQALFVILLLHRGEAVPVRSLIDELWGETPPPGAAKTLQVYVSRLRSAVGGELVVRRGGGYALQLGPGAVDIDAFERLLAHGRELLAREDAKGAVEALREALRLWRGPPLAEVASERFAQAEIARLSELHLACLEERIDADLVLGRHRELVSELSGLVRRHPRRERLRGQLMLAMYRTGRQQEALEAYRDARTTLVDELGLEPGPELQALERAILNQDAALGTPRRLTRVKASRRAGLVLAIGGALVLAAAVTAIFAFAGGGGTAGLSGAPPDSLAVINPTTNSLVAELPVGSGPAAVTLGGGSVWVANGGDQTLVRVDPAAKQVVDRIGLGRIPTQLAYGRGALWVASAIGDRGVVSRVDPASRAVVGSSTVRVGAGAQEDAFAPPTPSALAVGSAGVFTNDLHSRLWWLMNSDQGVRTLDLGAAHTVDGVAVTADTAWIASGADDRVLRVDMLTARVVASIPIAAVAQARVASPYAIAIGDGAVWVTDALSDSVSRIDPALNAVTATIKVGSRPTRLAIGEGGVWVLNAGDGTVTRIDPRRNAAVATIPVGADATGIAAGLGGVWVTVAGGPPHATSTPVQGPISALSSPSCSPVIGAGRGADLLIASDLPTSLGGPGPEPAIADARAAIRLVLQQHGFRAGPYRIAYQVCDDSRPNEGADPALCAANARAYALDTSLIGVIGAYNSGCTGVELPTVNAAPSGPVPMISPSNTYVGLTHAGPATAADEPDRYYPTGARNYVRLVAADDYQSAGIDLFLKQQRRTRLYLLNDGQGTGYAGAIYAQQAARKVGLGIAGSATWNPTARSYHALAQRIARSRADAVLLSGCVCSNGLTLITDLRAVLHDTATLIGTDNFSESSGFIHAHGAFDGLYISAAGLASQALPPSGKRFLATLLPGRRIDDIDQLASTAAQATEILLDAISRSNGTRASVTRELFATDTNKGITGPVSFDARGDPAPAPIAIYRIDSNAPRDPHHSVQGEVLDRVVDIPRTLIR